MHQIRVHKSISSHECTRFRRVGTADPFCFAFGFVPIFESVFFLSFPFSSFYGTASLVSLHVGSSEFNLFRIELFILSGVLL